MADKDPDKLDEGADRPPPPASGPSNRPYMVAVGLAFVALVVFAGINTIRTNEGGVLGVADTGAGTALGEFAIPDARSELTGDANIAQDDCKSSTHPCPADERRTPACQVKGEGVIDACDLFDKPSVLSFWFTRGGDCEAQEDVFETAYRRYSGQVNFLAVNVRDPRDTVRDLITERGWTHPVGLDSDGALSNLYRIGGCPTFLYVYPGGILQNTSIGELAPPALGGRIEKLIAASQRRAAG
ncbi:MAG: TlpA family protein disulfide reductase [Solirubrobacterales bacterium]